MKKVAILTKVVNPGVVAVVRADSKQEAMRIADACVKGGITAIEITFTVQEAEGAIQALAAAYANHEAVVIGAGTVLDAITARIAILAGAQFIVSPCFDEETAKLCNLYQIPYMPGCLTITEIKQALQYGVDIMKLFPGDTVGPAFVKAVKAPLPHVNIMPTGGVTLDNVAQWIESGCIAVGVGGSLLAPAKTGDYEKISEYAGNYIARVKEARGKMP